MVSMAVSCSVCAVPAGDVQNVSTLANITPSAGIGSEEDPCAGPGRDPHPLAPRFAAPEHHKAGYAARLYCEGAHRFPSRALLRIQTTPR